MKILNKIKKHKVLTIISVITIIGFILRVLSCYDGYPFPLVTDESVIVDNTIDMLSRRSWEAQSFHRPDQFEIKINAVLFTIVSYIKYGVPAYEAFENNKITFYLIARFVTAVFGTACIPLCALYVKKLLNESETISSKLAIIFSSIMTAFSPIFICLSSQARPDIILTFFVVLFSYYSIDYLKEGKQKYLLLCTLCLAIGITIKYNAAILVLPLALMVIYRTIVENRKISDIIKYAFCIFLVIFIFVFITAPNLITNIRTVVSYFIFEASTDHLGIENLGFFGNLKYYVEVAFKYFGNISIVLFILGVINIIKNKNNEKRYSLIVGLLFYICMSILKLHWERWGVPMFAYYSIMCSVGVFELLSIISKYNKKYIYLLAYVYIGILIINTTISGICYTKYCLIPRVVNYEDIYLRQNNIDYDDCISEGETSISIEWSQIDNFDIADNKLIPNNEISLKKYYVMTNSFIDRFNNEPDKYANECKKYNLLDKQYERVFYMKADAEYVNESNIFKNIAKSYNFLKDDFKAKLGEISIYSLNSKQE